jgi:hypothetical protein
LTLAFPGGAVSCSDFVPELISANQHSEESPIEAMRPIFTIHAGEFLLGAHLEKVFKGINIWIPAKDTGVDLLITDRGNKKAVSFQVKFSRDFLTTHMDAMFQNPFRVCGWFSLERQKIVRSTADYWVFVLIGSKKRSRDFILIEPAELLRRLDAIHGKQKRFQLYLWVTEKERCWDARGLSKLERRQIAEYIFEDKDRDFTAYLGDWHMVEGL